LSEIRHQDSAIHLIRCGLRNQRVPHASLFAGPSGVGKEMTARALAARLLCEAPDLASDADACGRCRSCRMMQADSHPDYHLIHRGLHELHPERSVRATRGLFITVDVIRHFLLEHASLRPLMGRRRVFVIREAERMNEDAQNALLKTLEEPAAQTCLILVSSSADRLLATIRSRCQMISFNLLPKSFVIEQLEARSADPQAAALLAGLAQGRVGVALDWLRGRLLDCSGPLVAALEAADLMEIDSFAKVLVEQAAELAARLNAKTQPADADEDDPSDDGASDDEEKQAKATPTDQLRDALKLVLMLAGGVLRDVLYLRRNDRGTLLFSGSAKPLEQLASRRSEDLLLDSIRAVAETEVMLDRNVAPQLACERLAAVLSGAVLIF
jgi:DNA polymerase III delta' subunit